jgi:hypothetical protein
MVAVAPNLDHIAHTKPGTRGKEGNNVFGCENGTPTRQESPRDLANERRMRPGSLSEGKKGKTKRTRGANNNKTHCKWNNEGWDQRTRRH